MRACLCMDPCFKKQKQSIGRVLLRQCCTSTFCPCWQACSAKVELSQIFSCNFMQASHLVIVNLGPWWPMQTKCILATCSTAVPGKLGASTYPFYSLEGCWPDLTCLRTIRSTEVNLLQAGFSNVFRLILEALFGNGLPSTGVLLKSQKGSFRLHFSLGMLLQDGSAHKTVWANRQDTGSKPCFLCKNIFQLRDAESSEGQCKVSSQFLEYKLASDEEVLQSWQRLAEKSKTLPKAEFNQWQQAAGLTYNEHALMSSKALHACHLLKPISLYCFDFMHTLCSHGVMNDIIFLVLDVIYTSGLKVWDNLHSWMGLWCLPKAYSNCSLAKLFDNKSVSSYKKARTFKCSASEVLAVYKPLQYFLQVMYVANGHMLDTCACYLTWAEVLDFLIGSPSLPAPSPPTLLQLVEKALKATITAGFGECMKPKMHWCLHLPDCLKRWTHLPSCWALERKHKTPRQHGGAHCNLKTYEKALLEAVTMDHLSILAMQVCSTHSAMWRSLTSSRRRWWTC